MITELTAIRDEARWLDQRKKYITSTESASLFGLQMPSLPTAYELWHVKRGLIGHVVDVNERMVWGNRLEDAIARGIAEDNGFELLPNRAFAHDEQDKIGGSFDYIIIDKEKGHCLLEIKTVAYRDYKMKFIEDDEKGEDGQPVFIEAPPYYEVQCQHELELLNNVPGTKDKYNWILLAVFVMDTRDVKLIWRERDREFGQALRNKIKEFWASTEPPPPDFEKDSDLLARMQRANNKDTAYDAMEDNDFEMAALAYIQEGEKEKAAATAKKVARSRMLINMGDCNTAYCKSARVSNKASFRVTELHRK